MADAPGVSGAFQTPEFPAGLGDLGADSPNSGAAQAAATVNRSKSAAVHAQGAGSPAVAQQADPINPRVLTSFNGLNHRNQRLANNGNQFSLEPPDQGLCVGNGLVLETINDVLRLFDGDGNPLSDPVDLNTFYGYPAAINRTTGAAGPFITDPSCLFDEQTQRWFHVVLTLEVVPTGPNAGKFTGVNHLDLAVSQTADPRGAWNIYVIPVTDDATSPPNHGCAPGPGTPPPYRTHPNACLGDFPHMGADEFGFFLTTNEYDFFGNGFHGAQIYAMSKLTLAAGGPLNVAQTDTIGMVDGKPGFTVWPAVSPGQNSFESAANGTEYFLSSMAADEVNPAHTDNRLAVWAITNTASLASASPDTHIQNTIIRVNRYGVPAPSEQKAGPFPLGQCINDTSIQVAPGLFGCWRLFFAANAEPKHDETEGPLDSSDSRILSTTFAGHKLFGTLDTSVQVGGQTKAGVAFYKIDPDVVNGKLRAELVHQGHLAQANNNVIYGAIGMTEDGERGAIGFTLVGRDHYPSAGYALVNPNGGAGAIHVIAEGLGPQDGFSEYDAFSTPEDSPARPRWGDYGAAVAMARHDVWLANEYIGQRCTLDQYLVNTPLSPLASCNQTRTSLGNWYTRISQVKVD